MTADRETYDVIVAGGGSAGGAAAVASARLGARTLLGERYNCLGGAATMRNVVTYCGLYTLGETPRRVVGAVDSLDGEGGGAHGAGVPLPTSTNNLTVQAAKKRPVTPSKAPIQNLACSGPASAIAPGEPAESHSIVPGMKTRAVPGRMTIALMSCRFMQVPYSTCVRRTGMDLFWV